MGAVAEGGVAPVEVKVCVEVLGDFQAGFFLRSEGAGTWQEFGPNSAPAGLGLSIVIGANGSA